MPKFSNAHLVLNSRDRTLPGSRGVYNNFVLANPGQNLVQGQMKDTALSEVLFPYDLPNMMPGYNQFELYNGAEIGFTVEVNPGFYTGTEWAAAWTAAVAEAGNDYIDPEGNPAPIPAADLPTCSYDPKTNRFTILGGNEDWDLYSPWSFAFGQYLGKPSADIGKDIMSIMGFPKGYSALGLGLTAGLPVVGYSAPLIFTEYIDICSPTLCQYQFIRDGSTTSLPRRVDLICRLYCENETSMPQGYDMSGNPVVTGTRPFVIHRQFKNQRVMRNTATNAINDVDIQLYDDCGQPLTTAWTPRNFQITFHVYEAGDAVSEANIGYRY